MFCFCTSSIKVLLSVVLAEMGSQLVKVTFSIFPGLDRMRTYPTFVANPFTILIFLGDGIKNGRDI